MLTQILSGDGSGAVASVRTGLLTAALVAVVVSTSVAGYASLPADEGGVDGERLGLGGTVEPSTDVAPGERVTIWVSVTNAGTDAFGDDEPDGEPERRYWVAVREKPDRWNLSRGSPDDWGRVDGYPARHWTDVLEPGGSRTATFALRVPTDARRGTFDVVLVAGTNTEHIGYVSRTVSITVDGDLGTGDVTATTASNQTTGAVGIIDTTTASEDATGTNRSRSSEDASESATRDEPVDRGSDATDEAVISDGSDGDRRVMFASITTYYAFAAFVTVTGIAMGAASYWFWVR